MAKHVSKKRSVIWEYFNIDPEDEKNAKCNTCDEAVGRGGASAKNFNTSNLRYHLKREQKPRETTEGKQNRTQSGERLMCVSSR